MRYVRFHHVFAGLLVMSGVSAFVVSPGVTDGARGRVEWVFWPVSRPVHLAGAWAGDRFGGSQIIDTGSADGTPRGVEELLAENERLRVLVAGLSGQLDELEQVNAERAMLGDLRALSTPVAVAGADAGPRESLILGGASLGSLRSGMPVLYSGGLAGRIERAGAGSGRVRLITDEGFSVEGSIGRFRVTAGEELEYVRIATPKPLVEGVGGGTMAIRNLTLRDVKAAGLEINDWVVLDDVDWPLSLRGQKLGRIVSIAPRPEAPLHAEIRLRPASNLLRLREVMVMTLNAEP